METARLLRCTGQSLWVLGLLHVSHVFALANLPAAALPGQAFAEVALPEHTRSYSIGPQMEMNGMPMRLTGFATRSTPSQTADWFARSLGQPLMDDQRGSQRILGRAQGEHYITVRLEPDAGGGTRGIVAVTHLHAAVRGKDRSQAEKAHWLRLLPAGTEIGSLLTMREDGQLTTHLVATNRHGEPLNAQRLIAALQDQGYALDHRFGASESKSSHASAPASAAGGLTLLLRGPGKEATAVITRDAQGLTCIVLVTNVVLEAIP